MGDFSGLPVRYFRVKNTSVSGPGENSSQQRILSIDGSWGPATTRRLQEMLNCSIKDGIISGQIVNRANQSIPSVRFGYGGSNVIRALQIYYVCRQMEILSLSPVLPCSKGWGQLQMV